MQKRVEPGHSQHWAAWPRASPEHHPRVPSIQAGGILNWGVLRGLSCHLWVTEYPWEPLLTQLQA